MNTNFKRISSVCGALLLTTGLVVNGYAGQQISAEQLAEDLVQFSKQLPERHIDLFDKMPSPEFVSAIAQLKNDLPGMSRSTFSLRLSQILARVGDGHTNIHANMNARHYFPVNFKILTDGIFVRAIDSRFKKAVTARLVSIGPLSANEVYKQLGTLIPHDNANGLNNTLDNQMNTAELLQFIGAAQQAGPTMFTFEINGQRLKFELSPLNVVEARQIKWAMQTKQPALFQQKPSLDFWNDWLAADKTLFFKYNRCRDVRGFQKLVDGTAGFIAQNDVERFVIDVRHNGGGSSRVFAPLLNYLSEHPTLNRKGRLFVIVGRQTFSSAVLNAIDMKLKTNAILIGEGTGGKPNHFGEIKTFQLSHSKLVVQYSTKKFMMIADSDDDTFKPDVEVKLTSKNWFAESDPFLEAALNYKD